MKKGMNPEAVEQMGRQIQQAGEDALTAFTEVSGRVEALDWTGEDRDRFVSEFTSGDVDEFMKRLKKALDELGERCQEQAEQQRQTSSP